jgi:hypothetical protein
LLELVVFPLKGACCVVSCAQGAAAEESSVSAEEASSEPPPPQLHLLEQITKLGNTNFDLLRSVCVFCTAVH